MTALRMCALEVVSLANCLLAVNASFGQNVNWKLLEEERLKLNQDCLHCVGGCPALVDLLLLDIKDVEANTGLSNDVRVRYRCE